MRWFRIRLVVLGLLLFVVHIGSANTCDTKFTDPSSSAILADVVIEGRVKTRPPGNDDRYNSTIQVRKILKGQTLINGGKRTKKIIVGYFGPLNKTECISEVKYNKKYIFFLRISQVSGKYFHLSALPAVGRKKTIRNIKKIVCKNCAKAPVIKKMANLKKKKGEKIKIRCSVKAKPSAVFSWYKDGMLIMARKGLRIKSGRRGSRLEVKKADIKDQGVYTCRATNAVGERNASVHVEIAISISSSTPQCKSQTYCLNGGTCFHIPKLKVDVCKCASAFEGTRCELLEAPEVIAGVGRRNLHFFKTGQAKLLHDRTLIIIGIVIAILVFIAICIISYYLAKRQRKKFEARRSSRNIPRQTRGHYQTLDEVDHGHHRFTARVCKDKGMQTDAIPELSPTKQPDSANGGSAEPRVFSMEQSFPAMPNPNSGQQKSNAHRPSRGSRSRLKAVSLDEACEDEPDCIPMTEMPRSLQSEGSIHDVVKRNKRKKLFRRPVDITEPSAEDVCNIESSDPVVSGAHDSFSDSLEDQPDEETHLFTDHTKPESDNNISENEEEEDVKHALLGSSDRHNDPVDLDTESEEEIEEKDLPCLHISEENLQQSWSSSLDTGHERSRDSEEPEDPKASNLGSNQDLSEKPIINHYDQEKEANTIPNGSPPQDFAASNFKNNPENSDKSSSSLTSSRDSVDDTTSGASSQPPDHPDKLAWDENGTPVSPNYAFTAAMNNEPLLMEDSYMHQEVPVSPTKQKEVCNRLLKDLREDQGPIQI